MHHAVALAIERRPDAKVLKKDVMLVLLAVAPEVILQQAVIKYYDFILKLST